MLTVTGSPIQAFVDAIKATLVGDATLVGLVTGIYGHVSEASRTAFPYLVLGHRGRNGDGGAMQLAGGRVTLQIDCWSDHKGASEAHAVLSRIAVLLERQPLALVGFELIRGSLTCEYEDVLPEPDMDDPKQMLYHGMQRWIGDVDELS